MSWISPRLLLFFSCFMVMISSGPGPSLTSLRVGALLVAAVSAGLALIRRMVVVDLDRLRRAEQTIVGILLVAGLILTGGMLGRTYANAASPMWFAVIVVCVILVCVILGLAAALPLTRRLPYLKWAFPIFLLVNVMTTVLFLRMSPSGIDVQVFLHDGAGALLHGHNPYSMTFPNIYQQPDTDSFYGPGVVVDGRITYGFPYPPVALVVAVLGQLLGDVRYGQLIAMLLTAMILRQLASDRIGRAAAVLGVAAPWAVFILDEAWTEPTLVALLACLVFALERRRHALAAVFLGLLLVSKQYVVVAIPVIWLIRQRLTRRVILAGVGVAAAITLPFFLINPGAFWKAIVELHLVQPFRSDSLSLLVSSFNTFGWPPPSTYSVVPLAAGGITAVALALRAPRTPPAFAAGVGLTLLVTILLSKQAFTNYYFLVSGAFLIAAVAWPTGQDRQTAMP